MAAQGIGGPHAHQGCGPLRRRARQDPLKDTQEVCHTQGPSPVSVPVRATVAWGSIETLVAREFAILSLPSLPSRNSLRACV